MFYEIILPLIIFCGIPFILTLIFCKYIEWPWIELEEKDDDQYERIALQRRVEEAERIYTELKATMGEEIDEILDGNDFNSIVEALNYVGKIASEAGCSISEMVDAFNALGTPSAETTETQEQKELQVIFEPKVMIIEPQDKKPIAYDNIISIKQDDKEVNPFDDWYNNFMKEIE